MNEDKKVVKDDNHYKSVGSALLSLILIVVLGIGIIYFIGFIDNNSIDFVGFLILALSITKILFPFLVLILLIGIFHRLRKNKK